MPVNIKNRSKKKEIIDSPGLPGELIEKNLQELDMLNSTLGGYSATIFGLKHLVKDRNRTYNIVDIGCGSGGTLKYIANWARKKGYQVNLLGTDNNPGAINYLEQNCKDYPEIGSLVCDYRDLFAIIKKPDIILSSLFCHHLSNDELINFFRESWQNSNLGFIVNDLQRNLLAYYLTYGLTRFFNGSELAKHDGPISVSRGFKEEELKKILEKSKVNNYIIRRTWAFRFLIIASSITGF